MNKFLFPLMLLCAFVMAVTPTTVFAAPPHEIESLYNEGHLLFWSGERDIARNFRQIPDVLDTAIMQGLNPDQYGADELRDIISLDMAGENAQKRDYAATYALWRYASDLAGFPLGKIGFHSLASARSLQQAIDDLAPQTTLYNVLKARLADIRVLLEKQETPIDKEFLSFGGRIVHLGESYADIPLLRKKMLDYGADESFGDDPYMYDLALMKAVKKFQEEHALKADGLIGPSTLAYLNRNLETEKEQIITNMARLRESQWRNRPDLRIDVDIARYWLTAYENGEVAFEMPVVVGTNKRQTNAFSTVMTGVRLNPGWTVPPTIKTEDYIPKLRSEPQWLTDKGIKIYASWERDAEPIDPTTVDWSLLTDGEIKAMRMYKSAGTENPLGLYRFLMNNHYDIYLHDTNQKYLFDRSMRAQSAGCVRVYDPRRIAEFLLKDDLGWTSEKLDEYLARGKTFDLAAKRHIPVYFDYKTVWLDETGKLILGADIYDFDTDSYRDMMKREKRTKDTISSYLETIKISEVGSSGSKNSTQDFFPISLF